MILVFIGGFAISSRLSAVSALCGCIISLIFLCHDIKIAALKEDLRLFCSVADVNVVERRTAIMLKCFGRAPALYKRKANATRKACYLVSRYRIQKLPLTGVRILEMM